MGRRSRRRADRAPLTPPEVEYRDAHGNVLLLRAVMTPATRREYAAVLADGTRSREDAWHRAIEFLFERLATRWDIAGAEPLVKQRDLLARLRFASQAERRFVRDALREHLSEHFPDVQAP